MAEPVGIALIGLGAKWGRQLAAAVARTGSVRLISCYARTPETRQQFAAEFGCQDVPSLEAALTAPGVRAAIIAAPAHVHLEATLACAHHGVHVLVEKPICLHLHEALQMQEACDRAGVVLMVNHEMRRLGSSRAMKRVVAEGQLGQVLTAVASQTLPGTFSPDNWRCHRETNRGGALMQLGIHQIDTLMYLLGPIVEVQGFLRHAAAPVDIDDVGTVHLTFESGATAVVTSNYISPKVYALHLYGERANLSCVADMLVWPDALKVDANTSLMLQTHQGHSPVVIEPQDCLALQLDEFARCVRGEAQPETGAAEGIAALAVVEAALRSSEGGVPVDPRTLV